MDPVKVNNERRRMSVAAVMLSVLLSVVVCALTGGWDVVGNAGGLFFGVAGPNATGGVVALPEPGSLVRPARPGGAPTTSNGSVVSTVSFPRPSSTSTMPPQRSTPVSTRWKARRIIRLKRAIRQATGKYRLRLMRYLRLLERH